VIRLKNVGYWDFALLAAAGQIDPVRSFKQLGWSNMLLQVRSRDVSSYVKILTLRKGQNNTWYLYDCQTGYERDEGQMGNFRQILMNANNIVYVYTMEVATDSKDHRDLALPEPEYKQITLDPN